MGPGIDRAFILSMLNQLNGKLQVIIGNHDEPNKKYAQDGLKRIIIEEGLSIDILPSIHEARIDGKDFVMCHFPMKDWHRKTHGSIHLHGHVHTQYGPNKVKRMIAEKRYDVGVDMYGGPVQITGDLRHLNDPGGWE
jgi:calcineurin-like phosphoesterase family protein